MNLEWGTLKACAVTDGKGDGMMDADNHAACTAEWATQLLLSASVVGFLHTKFESSSDTQKNIL